MTKLDQIRKLTSMISDPSQWVQNEWTERIAAELKCILEAPDEPGALHPTMAGIIEAHGISPPAPLVPPDLLEAAREVVKLLDDVGTESGWIDGGQTDRVYAWYEFDDLRAAIAHAESRLSCQHDFQQPGCTAIADDPRHAHCVVCKETWVLPRRDESETRARVGAANAALACEGACRYADDGQLVRDANCSEHGDERMCPAPFGGQNTVRECIDAGQCGCDERDAVKSSDGR